MKDLDKLFKDMLKNTEAERIAIGKTSAEQLFHSLQVKGLEAETAKKMIICFTLTFSAADGKVTRSELDFFNAMLGTDFSLELFAKMAAATGDDESSKMVDGIIDRMDMEDKSSALVMAMAIMSVDGKVKHKEKKYLETLLA